ncbi:MAG: DUF1667 domain-containing protein [Planctomycetota bacterium]|jgi:CxxC motif-containing protein|nr:DUF1667 domain-containing protein [Planctomycetota bacterium]
MKRTICIVCPRGCRLAVDEENDFAVEGAACDRGRQYGRTETLNPVRVLASTVKIQRAALSRCPVKTSSALPKALIGEAVRLLDGVELEAPIRVGAVVLRNILDTGIDFVATRSMPRSGAASPPTPQPIGEPP